MHLLTSEVIISHKWELYALSDTHLTWMCLQCMHLDPPPTPPAPRKKKQSFNCNWAHRSEEFVEHLIKYPFYEFNFRQTAIPLNRKRILSSDSIKKFSRKQVQFESTTKFAPRAVSIIGFCVFLSRVKLNPK